MEVVMLRTAMSQQVGQHLGSLEYLLPQEYVNTMKVLHSKAPESPLEEIKQVLEEELKCKVIYVYILSALSSSVVLIVCIMLQSCFVSQLSNVVYFKVCLLPRFS